MSHIPYYGEDLPTPVKTKRKTTMIYNYDQLIKHNLKFYDTFIDLKVTGWKTYSKAMNEYTQGFFKAQLEKSDEAVDSLGETMKSSFSAMRGVCK